MFCNGDLFLLALIKYIGPQASQNWAFCPEYANRIQLNTPVSAVRHGQPATWLCIHSPIFEHDLQAKQGDRVDVSIQQRPKSGHDRPRHSNADTKLLDHGSTIYQVIRPFCWESHLLSIKYWKLVLEIMT